MASAAFGRESDALDCRGIASNCLDAIIAEWHWREQAKEERPNRRFLIVVLHAEDVATRTRNHEPETLGWSEI